MERLKVSGKTSTYHIGVDLEERPDFGLVNMLEGAPYIRLADLRRANRALARAGQAGDTPHREAERGEIFLDIAVLHRLVRCDDAKPLGTERFQCFGHGKRLWCCS